MRQAVTPAILVLAMSTAAFAQPQLTVSATVVNPGATVSATITGTPGQNYALVGSSVGAGLTYAGVALAVGPDVIVLSVGTLDGTGKVTVAVRPPFTGTVLDRYYIQA